MNRIKMYLRITSTGKECNELLSGTLANQLCA